MPPPSKSQPSATRSARKPRGAAFFEGKHAPHPDPLPFFQPQLTLHPAHDPYEAEADRMAERVVDKSPVTPVAPVAAPPPVQRQAEKEEAVQEKPLAEQISKLPADTGAAAQRMPAFFSPGELEQNSTNQGGDVQTKTLGGNAGAWKDTSVQRQEEDEVQALAAPEGQTPNAGFEQNLQSSRGQGTALPENTRQQMESGFGADFSGVRAHTDPDAVQMNRDIGARAFTHGNDIYFNRGQYNPGAPEGDRLLAHELTHTIQQGAAPAVQPKRLPAGDAVVQRQAPPTPAAAAPPPLLTVTDISTAFKPDPTVAAFLDQNHDKYKEVPVRIKDLAQGPLKVKQKKKAKDSAPAEYKIFQDARQGLPFNGLDFLNPLRDKGVEPVIALNVQNPETISGFVSVRVGKNILGKPEDLIGQINKFLEPLGLLGVTPLKVPSITNKVENGVLTLKTGELSTTVAGFLDAKGSFGLEGGVFVFVLQTHVDVKGLAQGDFKIERNAQGAFSGEGEIAIAIANLSGKVKATYAAGDVTILGTVTINSEKFSGEVSIMVADAVTADKTLKAELGVQELETEKKKKAEPKAPEKKTKKNQVVVGWGTVKATITKWLVGTAKVGIDSVGHVTVIGTIEVPNEVELMEQKGKKIDLFKVEIKAGYGVPLVGQVGFFASIGMFINAGFGPLVLRNIKFSGTYSTDPSALQNFIITGSLGINAFAIIGLEAKAGIFLTLIGHDIKAGIKVTAAAGVKAYAEVTPTFEYQEKPDPAGGKVGEAWLKGHFEAAAQLFLKLAGSFFVELDSPWWSPAPDKTWDWPLGEVEYPIGPSMGIGGDVEWLVGSPEVPELKFSPVEFDPSKFTSDIMADPPPGKGGGKGGEQKGEGKWEDNAKKGDKEAEPEVKKGKGLEGKNKEDLSKLPEQERFTRALGEIGALGDAAKQKPVTFSVLDAKVKKVKQKYAIQEVSIKDKKDSSARVFAKQGKLDNSKNLIEVKLMSEAERQKLVQEAKKELETKQAAKMDPKAQTIKETDAKAIAAEVAGKYHVLESVNVVDGKETWDYVLDLGDKEERVKGKGKATEDKATIKQEVLESVKKQLNGTLTSREELTNLIKKIEGEFRAKGLIDLSVKIKDENSFTLDIIATASPSVISTITWEQVFSQSVDSAELEELKPEFKKQGYTTYAALSVDGKLLGQAVNKEGHAEEEILASGTWQQAVSMADSIAKNENRKVDLVLVINRSPCHNICSPKLASAVSNAKKQVDNKVNFVLAPTGTYEPTQKVSQEEYEKEAKEYAEKFKISLRRAKKEFALKVKYKRAEDYPEELRERIADITRKSDLISLQSAGWDLRVLMAREGGEVNLSKNAQELKQAIEDIKRKHIEEFNSKTDESGK